MTILENQGVFVLTGVYGYNERDDRFALWSDLFRYDAIVGTQP